MGEKISVKAKLFGTVNSVVDGSILHFNPTGSDRRAREREVDEADVQRLVDADLIHAPKGYRKSKLDDGVEETIGEAAERKLADDAANVDQEGEAPSNAGNRDSIAYQDTTPGGSDGTGLSEGDPDAPPPASTPAPAPKPTPSPAPAASGKAAGGKAAAPARGGRQS